MSRLYMLDTNIVSHIVKGTSPATRLKLMGLAGYEVACISAITEAELRYGLAKLGFREPLTTLVETFFTRVQVLSWGRDASLAYGQLRANQEAAGKSLGNLDLLIAAQALVSGATLVTRDKAFSLVSDLPVANWATDLQ